VAASDERRHGRGPAATGVAAKAPSTSAAPAPKPDGKAPAAKPDEVQKLLRKLFK